MITPSTLLLACHCVGGGGIATGLPPPTADTSPTADTQGDGDTSADTNTDEPIEPPASRCGDSPWIHVAVGYDLACGVHENGCSECWGRQTEGDDAEVPDDVVFQTLVLPNWGEKDEDAYHACGLTTDGETRCWGRNETRQATVPPGDYVHLSLGSDTTVGTLSNGDVRCWGGSHCETPKYILEATTSRAEIAADTVIAEVDGDSDFVVVYISSRDVNSLDVALDLTSWDFGYGGFGVATTEGEVYYCSSDGCTLKAEPGPLTDFCIASDWWCGIRAEDSTLACGPGLGDKDDPSPMGVTPARAR